MQEAAEKLDVGTTTLKAICRKNNILRWPARKRKKLTRIVEKASTILPQEVIDVTRAPQGQSQ